jgi:hypothetical protein
MPLISLPPFGDLNTDALPETADGVFHYDDSDIALDINFEDSTIDQERLQAVGNLLENLADYDQRNKKYLSDDFTNESKETVRTYVAHHLKSLDRDDLAVLVDRDDKEHSPEEQMVHRLRLVRIGFFPDHPEGFAIFDYTIGSDWTDYLVVVYTNEAGELENMSMES